MNKVAGRHLLIRADADEQIGTGHVMRCLALAQAWQDSGGHVAFVTCMKAPELDARLRSEGMEVVHLTAQPSTTEDAARTAELARQGGAEWVAVDGYHFGADYQLTIKDAGQQLLFLDDNGHAEAYYADIVLNQNICAQAGLYARRASCTRLLLGTRYALLRREFFHWRGWKREIVPVARKVLVTFGGADPGNITLKVIQALQQLEADHLEVVVVVGVTNPYYEQLHSAVCGSKHFIRLVKNVTNISELMAWSDVAVAAAGSTCWELAFMGLPSLIAVQAENQKPVASMLAGEGVFRSLGWGNCVSMPEIAEALKGLLVNRDIRQGLSACGCRLVDGSGGQRVVEALREGGPFE